MESFRQKRFASGFAISMWRRIVSAWARLRILPKRVLFAFSPDDATVVAEGAEQCLSLHPTTTSS